MRWEDLLFLHWPIAPELLRQHVPDGLELDTFDGRAWLGVVPFVMANTRFRWLPPMPTANRFPECNLRTYVRRGERTGVWFFSLDASSRLAVEGARLGFGLPYFVANLTCTRDGDRVHYDNQRTDRRAPPARLTASWKLTAAAAPAVEGTLEHFLVERYCLFVERRRRLVCGEIAHLPWQLTPVDLDLQRCDMTRLIRTDLAGPPFSALAAQPIDVAAWSPAPA